MRILATKSATDEPRRRRELIVFLVLTLLLAPALAVVTVGGYGFGVWMYQTIAGPPGPPSKAARPPGVTHEPQPR
jgi:periplasmic nitrate reductase NapE